MVMIFVSSANILAYAVLRQFGRAFIQIKKNKGPRMLPCGTPHLSSLALDMTFLATVT